nr:rhomboid family intramembrane serine protease [Pirellulaceae bacterium]
MRKLISYPAEPLLAQKLHAWLAVNQIDARCKQAGEQWEIWVLDEDQLPLAHELAATFNDNPDDAQFDTVLNEANKIELEKDKLQRARKKEANKLERQQQRHSVQPTKSLTRSIIILCSLLFGASLFPSGDDGSFIHQSLGVVRQTSINESNRERILDTYREMLVLEETTSLDDEHDHLEAAEKPTILDYLQQSKKLPWVETKIHVDAILRGDAYNHLEAAEKAAIIDYLQRPENLLWRAARSRVVAIQNIRLSSYNSVLLEDIKRFQLWRMVTPIFLHAEPAEIDKKSGRRAITSSSMFTSFLHIFFNMYWLFALGLGMERHFGTGNFALLVLFTGVISILLPA